MAADDERARKIAEAKARAEAARAARAGGGQPAAAPTPAAQPPMAEAPVEAPEEPAPETTVVSAAPAEPTVVAESRPIASAASAAPAAAAGGDGADERARRIAEAKARADAARAARSGGAPAQPAAEPSAAPSAPAAPAQPAAQAAPAAAAEQRGEPVSADERQRRIEEAKARAAAARADREGGAAPAPAQPAATPAAAAPAAAAAAPAAPAARPAAAAPTVVMAPAEDWRGTAAAPNRVLTARAETRAVQRRELRDVERRNLYTRRSIVRTSFWAALGVTLAGLALGFVNFFWPRQVVGFGGIVRIPASAVPQPGADPKRFPEGKLYLVNLKPGEGVPPQFQSLAPPSQNGGYLALWQKCPHLGCTVPWRPEFDFEGTKGWFRCPCHGSTYTRAGIRVFGPAPRPMDTFALKVNGDGSVEVDTSKITLGAADNANRAVLA